jgi:large subunit ribosomal protein L5
MGLPKSRLHDIYENEVKPALIKERGLENPMQVPRLKMVKVNIGVGEAKDNAKALEGTVKTLTVIAGQKPVVTRAKKSISNFKLREGQPVGVTVTLRGELMWHFLDKLMSITLPRVRDFQGVSVKGFDGRGNYNLGLRDQLIFPEIIFDEVEVIKGMQVTITTTADDDALAADLLYRLGMPFRDYKVTKEVA